MEKFLVDRKEVVDAIKRVIERYSSGKEFPTGIDLVLETIKGEMINEINKIDPQEITGIDFTYGGRIPQEVVKHCQFRERGI